MSEPNIEKQLSDGLIVCGGMVGGSNVVLYTANKEDAETLYSAVEPVAESNTRELEQTDQQGIHREYYLDLAESEHTIKDEEDFEWNTRSVWKVTFTPSDYFQQRMLHWIDEDDETQTPPTDFSMTPLVAKLIYFAGAFEMSGKGGEPYIEFDAIDSDYLDAELKNLDIESTHVGELWRLDPENSAKFRAYAGIPAPQVDTEGADNGGD